MLYHTTLFLKVIFCTFSEVLTLHHLQTEVLSGNLGENTVIYFHSSIYRIEGRWEGMRLFQVARLSVESFPRRGRTEARWGEKPFKNGSSNRKENFCLILHLRLNCFVNLTISSIQILSYVVF